MNEGKRFLGAQYQFLVDEDSGTRCYSHDRHLRLPGIFGFSGTGDAIWGKGGSGRRTLHVFGASRRGELKRTRDSRVRGMSHNDRA